MWRLSGCTRGVWLYAMSIIPESAASIIFVFYSFLRIIQVQLLFMCKKEITKLSFEKENGLFSNL